MKVNMTNTLILDERNHVLLIHNCKNGSDRYEFPGGKVEPEDNSLEERTKIEVKQELGIEIDIKDIFGDYETDTPEGKFLCRTFYGKIIYGIPRIMEPKKADWCGYVNHQRLEELRKQGTLVPNLVSALPRLKGLVSTE